MSQVDDLRDELIKRQRAATAKISRNKRVKGINLAGTEFDPRIPTAKIKRLTSAQLKTRLQKVNMFLRRDSQFVALNGGKPLSIQRWRQFNAELTKYNAKGAQVLESLKNVKLPFGDRTIGQRELDRREKTRGVGDPVNRTYEHLPFKPSNIADVRALEAFEKNLKRRNSLEYKPERVRQARWELDQMLKRIGNEDARARVSYLSDEQFFAFWEYGSHANDIGMQYDIAKLGADERTEAEMAMMEDSAIELNELLSWAENELPVGDEPTYTPVPSRRPRYSTTRKTRR